MKTTPIIGYKLFKLRKDGSLGPLFIDAKLHIPIGEWLEARTDLKPPKTTWKVRPGWHVCQQPVAPHLNSKLAKRVWAKVEIEEVEELPRPERLGGNWQLARRIKVLGILEPIQVKLMEIDYHNRHLPQEERNKIRFQGFIKAIMES